MTKNNDKLPHTEVERTRGTGKAKLLVGGKPVTEKEGTLTPTLPDGDGRQGGFKASFDFTAKADDVSPEFRKMMEEMDSVNQLAQAVGKYTQEHPLARTADGKYLNVNRIFAALSCLTANFIVHASNPGHVSDVATRYIRDLQEQIEAIQKVGKKEAE